MNQTDTIDVILRTAADEANRVVAGMLPLVEGTVFIPNQLASRKHGFCLTYTEAAFNALPPAEIPAMREELQAIAVEAVRNAIVKHGQEFGGLVISHAKHGQNFFGDKDEGMRCL